MGMLLFVFHNKCVLYVTDFSSRLLLAALVEQLSGKDLPMKVKAAKLRVALQFIASQGVKLVNIDGEGKIRSIRMVYDCHVDIVDGNLKFILARIWHLIIRYQIQGEQATKSEKSERAAGTVAF